MLLFILLIAFCSTVNTAFVWISGQSSPAATYGEFGTRNVSSPDLYTTGLTDHDMIYYKNRIYWFGGYAGETGSYSNNMWSFDLATYHYTWYGGDGTGFSAPMNAVRRGNPHFSVQPGGRTQHGSFIDKTSGNMFIFGGLFSRSIVTNTIFSFNFQSLFYTYVGGTIATNFQGNYGIQNVPATKNEPPAVHGFVHFYDPDTRSFYFWGGATYEPQSSDILRLSDTWVYNVTSGNWTWIQGPGVQNSAGKYGKVRESAAENYPGGRVQSSFTYDVNEKALYMFGGEGITFLGEGVLNDVWCFNLSNTTWTWIGGTREIGSLGRIPPRNTYTSLAVPRGRLGGVLYVNTEKKRLYLLGGLSIRGSTRAYMSDLWVFSLEYFKFAWVGGSTQPNGQGSYGNKGSVSSSNYPPAKSNAGYIYNNETKIMYFHGGFKADSAIMNDFWLFEDDVEDPELMQDEVEVTLSTTTQVATSIQQGTRTLFAAEEPVTEQRLPSGAIIGIAGGTSLLVVVLVLILLQYIRRQSLKEAIFAATPHDTQGATADVSKPDQATINSGNSDKFSAINVPTPLVKYSSFSVQKAKDNAPQTLKIDGQLIDVINQIGTQNGVPLFNGLLKKHDGSVDKVTVKAFGSSFNKLQAGVEDSFWKEVEVLSALSSSKGIVQMLHFSINPFTIIFPYYSLGTLETYLSQSGVSPMKSSDLHNIVSNVANALKDLHDSGYVHRTVKLRNVYIERNSVGSLTGYLSGFGCLQQCFTDEDATIAFPLYRIDAKSANFVAPEVFRALRGDVVKFKTSEALKAGDSFSLAMLISKLLKSAK